MVFSQVASRLVSHSHRTETASPTLWNRIDGLNHAVDTVAIVASAFLRCFTRVVAFVIGHLTVFTVAVRATAFAAVLHGREQIVLFVTGENALQRCQLLILADEESEITLR